MRENCVALSHLLSASDVTPGLYVLLVGIRDGDLGCISNMGPWGQELFVTALDDLDHCSLFCFAVVVKWLEKLCCC